MCELSVEGGGGYRAISDCPSGDPEAARYGDDPDLMRREVEAKVRALFQETGFAERTDPLIDLVGRLDDARDLAELGVLLRRHSADDDNPSHAS
jgi:hypothetical protein